jgi:filamentous haemagglutinin family N-terminal domain
MGTNLLGLVSLSAIATLLSLIANIALAHAQITTDGTTKTEVNGNAIAPTGSGTVFGSNLFHSFTQFNVPTTGVQFTTGTSSVNGSAINNIINRVTGSDPSRILGTIESRTYFPNANLYLLNPNGVIFGANARLDIGGSFFATTGTGLNFTNGQTFLADRNSLTFPSGDVNGIRFGVENPAGIINQGHLQVESGKTISLTAGTVINTGTLTANGGNVSLASVNGNSLVELRSPDAVLGLSIKANAIPSDWNGSLASIPKLAEQLTGSVPEADRVIIKPDGSMWLVGKEQANQGITVEQGLTITSGQINTSNHNGTGGNVGIYGNKVALVNANVNANGTTGGGTILVGGDYKGEGTVPNAQVTFVSRNSTISSDGLVNGNGGKVIFWADNTTRFYGTVSSRGGSLGGDGGFIEISGKRTLVFDGNVYANAPFGKKGTVLFDPQVIEIISSTSSLPSQPHDDQLDANSPLGSDNHKD